MQTYFEAAIDNITRHGDTDVFPFPFENHLFYDQKNEVIKLLMDIHSDFRGGLATYGPVHESVLAPVGYFGYRWATQLDPIWNAYFLGLVLSIAKEIERSRIPIDREIVYSYRFNSGLADADVFLREWGWKEFMEKSIALSQDYKYVVICDISDFYARIYHHRLENALDQLRLGSDIPDRIIKFLSHYSNGKSYGLPVGGPAARLLSELVLNQIDRLLLAHGVVYCRFSDDFHLFANSLEGAYQSLILLSEKLLQNEGLTLQKAKTRVLSGTEFRNTAPLQLQAEDESRPEVAKKSYTEQRKSLLRFSVRFDPYSPTAAADYETLKNELRKFDILGLLRTELQKSQVHIAFARKLTGIIKFLDEPERSGAVISLIENAELLYPIFSNVMIVVASVFDDLSSDIQDQILAKLQDLIRTRSHVVQVDLNVAFAIRVLGRKKTPESEELLNQLYLHRTSALIRRDIILIMAKWKAFYWLSDLKNRFRSLTDAERRAFIVASYSLGDEGSYWRQQTNREFSKFEKLVQSWMATKTSLPNWEIPV